MEIYKQRMIEEYKQLKKRAEKLSIVLNRYYLDELIVNSMKNDFRRMRKELREELGFDSYNWSDSFRNMRRDIKSNKELISEINSLDAVEGGD
ncbi:TPA: hypothetical protein ACHI5I_000988 [Streptococcus pyogenes]